MNKEIEVLDIDDDEPTIPKIITSGTSFKEEDVVGNILEDNDETLAKKKRRRLKKGIFQTLFCLLSLTFIIGCCVFYGKRALHYYKIYNPKSKTGAAIEKISTAVAKDAPIVFEGEGLYRENGVFVYKGEDVDNYIIYSNLTWRIIRTNPDGSLELILDDYINILGWDFAGKSYIDSDIHAYLNDIFVKELNTNMLDKTSICTDKVETIDKFSCKNKNTEYFVKLLPINDFLNSNADEKTFVSKDEEQIWLGTSREDEVWHANGASISSSVGTQTYFVKPVVTIKNSTKLVGGKGTKKNPYVIDEKKQELNLGSYVKLGNDTWIVYETSGKEVKLVYSTHYQQGLFTYRFDSSLMEYDPDSKNSLAEYLNTTFYEELEYKSLLRDMEINTGAYNKGYKDTYNKKATAKVGVPSVTDLKFNNTQDGYYIANASPRDKIFYYREDLISSNPGISRPVRPTICIKKAKIKSGNGTKSSPYQLEV